MKERTCHLLISYYVIKHYFFTYIFAHWYHNNYEVNIVTSAYQMREQRLLPVKVSMANDADLTTST